MNIQTASAFNAEPLVARPQQLTDALARLASGVAVIACWDGDTPRGLLVSSLISLSVEPPRVLFTVREAASASAALARATYCTASILSHGDQEEAAAYASADATRRFLDHRWLLDDPDAPRFRGGLATFDLEIEERIASGTHTIVIAAVRDFHTRSGSPLVYFERNLHVLR